MARIEPVLGGIQEVPMISTKISETPEAPLENRFQEFYDTQVITEQIQSGTIRHSYLLNGSPGESLLHPALEGYQLGMRHPWFPDAYISQRTFRYHVHSSDKEKRATRLDLTYQRMPCPNAWAVNIASSLAPYQTWWTLDEDEPEGPNPAGLELIKMFPGGTSIPRPQTVMSLRRPFWRRQLSELLTLANKAGRKNSDEWAGQPPGYWLFRDIRVQQLYGRVGAPIDDYGDPQTGPMAAATPSTGLPAWDVTVVLVGDPWRRHEQWYLQYDNDTTRVPTRPAGPSFEQQRAAHYTLNLIPWTLFGPLFDDYTTDACQVPDLGDAPQV